jgi:hypothetical protein
MFKLYAVIESVQLVLYMLVRCQMVEELCVLFILIGARLPFYHNLV